MNNSYITHFCFSRLGYFLPTSKSRDTNGDKSLKPGPDKLYIVCPNLRIRGHLPAAIVNGEEIAFESGRISDIQRLVTLTLTLDRVILRTSYITRRHLPTYQI